MAQSVQVQKVNWWHERLADIMISEPQLTLGEIAAKLRVTLPWLSTVKNSDVFKDYWVLRSRAHSEALTSGIKEKAAALAEMSLDVLLQDTAEKIETNSMSSREARENLELVTKRFGFDGSSAPQTPNSAAAILNFNFGLVTRESLEEAREKMRKVQEPVPLVEDKSSDG